ncbi:hypothetical protein [Legionella sp. W05-934-2]|uniref:hypothetical protein n=1 Tax=Legionella sp. W05-934-2 TaxID=1198649 RepID=UPI003461B881
MKKNKNIIVWSNHPHPPIHSVEHWRDPLENVLIGAGYDSKQPPMSDLLKWYHNLLGDWVVISPVYFHTTHNDSVIAQCGPRLNLDDERGRWYFDKISDFFQQEGIRLHYHSPTLWLGQMNEPVLINSFSPSYLHNKSLMPYLAQLGDDMVWQKRMTEAQMYLHTLQPMTQSSSIVNGVWFWGQGELSLSKKVMISDDANMMRLADIWPDMTIKSPFEAKNVYESELIVLTEYCEETLAIIERACRSFSCNWSWNNITYQQPAKRWWQMLRRTSL